MKVTQFTRFVTVLGFAGALGLAPAMAQTASGTMAPAPAMSTQAKTTAKLSKDMEFKTQAAAAAHCPGDTVVWSSLSKSKSFHTSDSKYFGKTKHGAYVCKGDALAAGFHQTKN